MIAWGDEPYTAAPDTRLDGWLLALWAALRRWASRPGQEPLW